MTQIDPPSSNDPLQTLQQRIQDLKGDVLPPAESPAPETADDKQGLGAAYELIMTPLVCGGIGAGLDHFFSTSPVLFMIFAILGVCAGFWRIYRVSQNIQTPLDLKRLQRTEKQGMNTQLSEKNTEQS